MELSTMQLMTDAAMLRIQPYILHTPLLHSVNIGEELGASVYLKLENEQKTGSFKLRGAFNKTILLKNTSTEKIITASTGNHGLACAHVFKTLGVEGQIFVPVTAAADKVAKLEEAGADVVQYGDDCEETEGWARHRSVTQKCAFISPYNDYDVIAGQGTVGKEILQDLPSADVVFVSVGGGGLVSGIGAYIKSVKPQCKIIGCSPVNSKVMHESIKAGRIIQQESYPTLSDGTAGGVEEGSVTFKLCERVVDDWVLVTEDEISLAVYYCIKQHSKIVEGSAGVALAAVRKVPSQLIKDKNVVVVLCGANLGIKNLQHILNNAEK